MPSQAVNANLSFNIKLLSGKNVVLVECPGFESELFLPQIIKGRINFQNIIPTHRCCNAAAANVQTDQLILPGFKLGGLKIVAASQPAKTPQKHSYAEMQVSNLSGPLARSTPSNGRPGKENILITKTPERARFKPSKEVVPQELPGEALEKSLPQLIDIPTLNVSDTMMHSSPLRFSPNSTLTLSGKSMDSCLSKAPPMKTYSRPKPNASAQTKPPISWSPLQKKKKTSKVSSTKPLSPAMKLEVRHRKLIVDNKKSISSNVSQKPVAKPITKTAIRRLQVTGKTRVQFEALKETAYDRLTLPGRGHVSDALSKQFKDACLDKYMETLPTYAALAKTAPLQMDRQVKTLMAKEKRLEKQLTKSQLVRITKS
ncbi:uncharacterized protein LOC132793279 [Drosophila nasuta]|uniref:uncharacterized protein LOC132793279 n=1 Tax=Drosophila nasuta TaxID=42062 RepID=UPI00295E43A5|nr:uncharacterized protein LOC132793279 [Drosophila nasuta]